MPEPIIELEAVTRRYHTEEVETLALSGIDLIVEEGEFVAITGPSGSGKSTLLSVLGLLESPDQGRYSLGGRTLTDLSPRERALIRNREIGFVFQAFNLIGDLTVLENVALPLVYRGDTAREQRERARTALEQVGMAHRLSHYPAQLSGGQQQRVAVARAIVGEPSILLADEPTGNLDSENGRVVMDLLSGLHDLGATICMVTHDAGVASRAGRRVEMDDGRICGPTGGRAG